LNQLKGIFQRVAQHIYQTDLSQPSFPPSILPFKMPGPRIFLYRMMTDAGSAPNVAGNVCTLAICKPQIRRSAKVGDILVGLRAKSGKMGALGPHAVDSVLYVMRVTDKKTFAEYDSFCCETLPIKIPTEDRSEGDCLYRADGTQRPDGHHGPYDVARDLSGRYVLLGAGARTNFWYRRDPVGVRLPAALADALDVESVRRGHRVRDLTPEIEAQLMTWLATFPTAAPEAVAAPARRCKARVVTAATAAAESDD
jgi:hypothetical protein